MKLCAFILGGFYSTRTTMVVKKNLDSFCNLCKRQFKKFTFKRHMENVHSDKENFGNNEQSIIPPQNVNIDTPKTTKRISYACKSCPDPKKGLLNSYEVAETEVLKNHMLMAHNVDGEKTNWLKYFQACKKETEERVDGEVIKGHKCVALFRKNYDS